MEIKEKKKEKIEILTCSECQKPMEKINNKFKCFKCGIEVELK